MRAGGFAVCIGDYHADVVLSGRGAPPLTPGLVEDLWNGAAVPGVSYPPGGVGLTVSCAIARLGASVRPLGVIGADRLGRVAAETLSQLRIDLSYLQVHPTRHSITVLCMTDETGERSFAYGAPMAESADVSMTVDQIPPDTFEGASLLYVSGIQLVYGPGCFTALELMEQCRRAGITVAVDLNLRPEQYPPEGALLERYRRAVELSDLVFGSGREELMRIVGGQDAYEASCRIARQGKTAVCKLGAAGAAVFTETCRLYHPDFPVQVVDTIGAGDNFVGAYLARFLMGDSLDQCLIAANAAGAYSVSRPSAAGGIGPDDLRSMMAQATPAVTADPAAGVW